MENQDKNTPVMSTVITPTPQGPGVSNNVPIAPKPAPTPVNSPLQPSPYEAPIMPDENSLESNPQAVSTQPTPTPPTATVTTTEPVVQGVKKPLINKALLGIGAGALVIVVAVALLTGMLSNKRAGELQSPAQSVNEQGVTLGNASPDVLSVLKLQGSQNKLIVNGDIITSGRISMAGGNYYGQFVVNNLTANREYVLPDASGSFCLSSNNCNFVTDDSQTTINNFAGALTIQGTPNQVNVTTNGNVISLTTPQDIATTSAPTFASITVTGSGASFNGVAYTLPSLQGNGVLVNDGSGGLTWSTVSGACPSCFVNTGNSFGSAATLGTNDNFALNFETNGISRAQITTDGAFLLNSLVTGGSYPKLHVPYVSGDGITIATNSSAGTSKALAYFGSGTDASNDTTALVAESYSGFGIEASSVAGIAISGISQGAHGVVGITTATGTDIAGVYGWNPTGGGVNSYGVLGSGQGIFGGGTATGVGAISDLGYGLYASSNQNTSAFIQASKRTVCFFGCVDYYPTQPTVVIRQLETRTQDLLSIQDSAGTAVASFTYDGRLAIGPQQAFIPTGISVANTLSGSTCAFGCWGVFSNPVFSHNALVSNFGGARIQYSTAASTPINRGFGLYIGNPSLGAGSTVAENYGLFVEALSSGTTDFGIAVGTADTQTLWISHTSNSTTANGGIAFGSSRDTNLYRSAADTLRTDDSLSVGTNLRVEGTATIGNGIATPYMESVGASTVLNVYQTFTTTQPVVGANIEVSLDPTGTTSGGYATASLITTPATNAQSIGIMAGIATGALHQGSGNVDNVISVITSNANYGSGTILNSVGVHISEVSNSGSGTIISNTGISIDSMSTALNNTGIQIGNMYADTGNAFGLTIGEVTSNSGNAQALWLQGDLGDADNGIAFGSNRDTNLYRSAADTLRTDDSFEIGGALRVSDGSELLPSISFASDPDTGFYKYADNTLGLTTGGGILARFTDSQMLAAEPGAFGTPFYAFAINPDSGMYYDAGFFAPASVRISMNGVSSLAVGETGIWSVLNGTAANPVWSFYDDRDSGMYLAGADLLGFSVAGVEKMTIGATELDVATDTDIVGHLAVGSTASVGTDVVLKVQETFTANSGSLGGINVDITTDPTAASSVVLGAGVFQVRTAAGDANGATWLIGSQGRVDHNGTGTVGVAYGNYGFVSSATGTITNALGAVGQVDNWSNTTFTAGIGLLGTVKNAGSGTITTPIGVLGAIYSEGSGTLATAVGLSAQTTLSGTGNITENFGIQVANPVDTGAGSIATNIGIHVQPQTTGTLDFGVSIGAADTQTLWLSSNADNTTANAGIAFGSSRDTNLYRSAADVLKTDDSLHVGTKMQIGSDALVGTIAQCNLLLALGPCTSSLELGTASTETTNQTNGINNLVTITPSGATNTQNNRATNSVLALGGTQSFSGVNMAVDGHAINAATAGTVTYLNGVTGFVTQAGAGSTVATAVGVRAGVAQTGGTITTAIGLDVLAATGTIAGNNYGVYIRNQTAGATDYGLYIEDAANYSLYLASTDGDAASGITFGADTNLYRSAASTLRTDDLFVATGGISSPGSGTNSEQFGSGAAAAGTGSIALGNNATTTNDGAIAIGYQSSAPLRSTTIGTNASGAQDGVTIGRAASSSGANSVAVGQSSSTSAANAVALGDSAQAAGSAVALGSGANASASSIALGRGATTTATNQLVVGSSTTPITDFYLGNGVTNASPNNATINATGGSGTDIAGANLILAGGRSTGSGNGGSIVFQVSPNGSTGSSLNALQTALSISSTGQLTSTGLNSGSTSPHNFNLVSSNTAGGGNNSMETNLNFAVGAVGTNYAQIEVFQQGSGSGGRGTLNLFVRNSGSLVQRLSVDGDDGITFTGIAGATTDAFIFNNSTGTGDIIQVEDNGTAVFRIADGGATTLQNTTNSTNALRVLNAAGSTTVLNVDTTNGRVGIGTAAPEAALEVTGDIYLTKEAARTIKVADSTTAATAGAQLNILGANGSSTTSGTGGAIVMTAGSAQAGNSNGGAVTISGGSSAGIATGGHLNLSGGGGLTGGNVVINAGSGVADGQIRIASTDGLVALGHANNAAAHLDIRSRVSATDALSVDNVGVAANIAVFKDNGTGVFTLADGGAATFQNATDSTTGFRVLDQDGGTPILNVDTTNERVGIGTATPGFNLDLLSAGADGTTVAQFMNAGASSCTVQPGGTGFSCTSDARLKTNVVTVINPLDTVRQLRGVTFNWNSNPDGEMQVGFIAQELEQLIPSAVSTDGRGYKVANYQAIIPYLVGAAQEQDSRIAGLQQGQSGSSASLTNLSSRLNSLEQRVNALESQLGTTSGNLASLNVSGPASVQNLTVTGAATVAQLTVTGDARIVGNLTLEGFVLGNESTRGTVTIPAGQTEVKKTFTKPYNAEPNVILTPKNGFAPSYRVEATATDFTVYFQVAALTDIVMNYQIQQ